MHRLFAYQLLSDQWEVEDEEVLWATQWTSLDSKEYAICERNRVRSREIWIMPWKKEEVLRPTQWKSLMPKEKKCTLEFLLEELMKLYTICERKRTEYTLGFVLKEKMKLMMCHLQEWDRTIFDRYRVRITMKKSWREWLLEEPLEDSLEDSLEEPRKKNDIKILKSSKTK